MVEWDLMLDLVAQVVVENLLSLVDEEEGGDPWVDDLAVIVLAPHLVVVALVAESYLIHRAILGVVVVVVVGATMTISIMVVVVVVVTMMTIELCCHRGEVEEFDQCPAIPH